MIEIVASLIAALATVTATILAIRMKPPKQQRPNPVREHASQLRGSLPDMIRFVRRFDSGLRLSTVSDTDMRRRALCTELRNQDLVRITELQNGEWLVTITDRGLKVAAALDAMTRRRRKMYRAA